MLAAWSNSPVKNEKGVLVGSDITQEWLLPWWWENYQKNNRYEVAFIDFGMSFEKKDWCRERGKLIPLRFFSDFVVVKSKIDTNLANEWMVDHNKSLWESRNVWFKKPFACLKTPFLKTIWIDLDCEIRGSIQDLFSFADKEKGIGMARCTITTKTDRPYNSGVIAYLRNLDLIVDWALLCKEKNEKYFSDDVAFSSMIKERKININEIPPEYNWSRLRENGEQAVILHWHGERGKEVIRNRIHLEGLKDF